MTKRRPQDDPHPKKRHHPEQPRLDIPSFPHLAERICALTDTRALLALRATCKAFTPFADAFLVRHLVIAPARGGLGKGKGKGVVFRSVLAGRPRRIPCLIHAGGATGSGDDDDAGFPEDAHDDDDDDDDDAVSTPAALEHTAALLARALAHTHTVDVDARVPPLTALTAHLANVDTLRLSVGAGDDGDTVVPSDILPNAPTRLVIFSRMPDFDLHTPARMPPIPAGVQSVVVNLVAARAEDYLEAALEAFTLPESVEHVVLACTLPGYWEQVMLHNGYEDRMPLGLLYGFVQSVIVRMARLESLTFVNVDRIDPEAFDIEIGYDVDDDGDDDRDEPVPLEEDDAARGARIVRNAIRRYMRAAFEPEHMHAAWFADHYPGCSVGEVQARVDRIRFLSAEEYEAEVGGDVYVLECVAVGEV